MDPLLGSRRRPIGVRRVRKQRAESLGDSQVCDDGVSQAWIGQFRQHRRLHNGHDLARL